MINRANVRVVSAALIGIALLCFPACGPEDSEDPAPPPVDPARNPQEDPTSRAARDGLAGAQPDQPTEQVWKVADPGTGGDRREPTCALLSAAAALPSAAATAERFGTTVEPPVICRAGTTGLVPVTPLPPAGDSDHVQVVQRD